MSPCAPLSGGGCDTHDGHENSPILVFFSNLLGTDNGPEFTAQPLVDWCAEHGVAMHYIQPGKPDQNAYIERFNRSYRTEVLNAYLVESLTELRALTELGFGSTTASGPMTASAGCRRSRFCRGIQRPASLLSNCPLDGEAYATVSLNDLRKWCRTSIVQIETFYDQLHPEMSAGRVAGGSTEKKKT